MWLATPARRVKLASMARPRVFIDGHVGTTGLRIRELLGDRADLELISLDEELRKDPATRQARLREADIAILCLPDEAAREAAGWLEGDRTRLIDASTAHRLSEGWVYGLPELAPGQRAAIREARYVSNAGCYATALLLAVRPLVDGGLLPRSARLSLSALSGYSGGGRPMIERWEDPERGFLMLPYTAPYALERIHKHVPEMQTYAELEEAPLFMPSVGPFRTGMRMLIPLHAETLPAEASPKAIWEALHSRYDGEPFVRVLPLQVPLESDESSFDPRACNDTNRLEIVVAANPAGHVVLIVLLDNLGKGAAGVAVQNLNLMLGLPEAQGLRV